MFRTLPFHMLPQVSWRRLAIYHTPPGAAGFSGWPALPGWRVPWFSGIHVSGYSSGLFTVLAGAFSWAHARALSAVTVTWRAFGHGPCSAVRLDDIYEPGKWMVLSDLCIGNALLKVFRRYPCLFVTSLAYVTPIPMRLARPNSKSQLSNSIVASRFGHVSIYKERSRG